MVGYIAFVSYANSFQYSSGFIAYPFGFSM